MRYLVHNLTRDTKAWAPPSADTPQEAIERANLATKHHNHIVVTDSENRWDFEIGPEGSAIKI